VVVGTKGRKRVAETLLKGAPVEEAGWLSCRHLGGCVDNEEIPSCDGHRGDDVGASKERVSIETQLGLVSNRASRCRVVLRDVVQTTSSSLYTERPQNAMDYISILLEPLR